MSGFTSGFFSLRAHTTFYREGISIDELKAKVRDSYAKPKILPEAQKLYEQRDVKVKPESSSAKFTPSSTRKDNSPVKVRSLAFYDNNII